MCGLCGTVSDGRVDPDRLRAMTRTLVHRGPDDEGFHVEAGVGLGHRRLSIIDIEGGAQPMSTPDGTVWIVYNGEIYNYRSLRRELSDDGFPPRTRSDTEVILNAYLRDGTDCLRHLRGMFAFAIWDGRKRRLFAARDRMGQKPFYYVHRPGELHFASEIKALLRFDPDLCRPDLAALDEYFTLRVVSAPRSVFADVRKLPPAHFLTFSPEEGVRVARYWDPVWEPKLEGDDEELVEELERRAVDAIRAHLVSDVPVGAFLSGGLDSTLVVALLMKHGLMDGLRTFSVGLPLGRFDEAPLARLVAERYGTRHHEEVGRPSLLRDLPRLIRQLDEPSDFLPGCIDLIARVARRDVRVVLGGDGGDELFAGYDRYLGTRLADRYATVPGFVRRGVLGPALSLLPDGRWYRSPSHRIKWLHRLAEYEGSDRYIQALAYAYVHDGLRSDVLGPALLEAQDGGRAGAGMRTAWESARTPDALDRMLAADLASRLPDHPVMVLDRMTMAHSLEARSPFMDHELHAYVARLPSRLKVRGRRLRVAQTLLARRLLPPELLRRGKQGFASAIPYLLRDELAHLHRAFLTESRLAQAGLLNPAGISTLLAEHRAGRRDHGSRLGLFLNAEVWFRTFMDGDSESRLLEVVERAPGGLAVGAGSES